MQGHLFVQGKAEPLLGSLKCFKEIKPSWDTSHGKYRLPCADVDGGMLLRLVTPREDLQDVGSTHYVQARNRLVRRALNPRSALCRSRNGPAGAMKLIWSFFHVGMTLGGGGGCRENKSPTVLRLSLLCGGTIGKSQGIT